MSEREQVELLRNQLGDKSREELENMLATGHSLSDIIKYFMSPGSRSDEDSTDLQNTIQNILNRQDLSEQEKIDVIISKLNEDEKKIFEKMLSEGKPIEEIIKVLLEQRRENSSTLSRSASDKNLQNVADILSDSTLSIEQKFELLKGNMKSSELKEIQKLLDEGLSVEEALRTVADLEESLPGDGGILQESDFAKLIKKLIKGKCIDPNEMLELMKEYLNDDEIIWMNEMIKNKYNIQDVINYFMKHGKGRYVSEFEIEMRELIEGQSLTEDQILKILQNKLSPGCRRKLEEMMKSGAATSEIVKYFLKNGKTDEMELLELKSSIESLISDSHMSAEEKVNLVKNQLDVEAKCLMEELLKQGYSKDEVMELFLRCANDLTLVNADPMFKKTVRFSDEPPDAFLYEARNVWTMIDVAEVKLNIPMMTNSAKCATFASFFGKVVKLTTGRGLTHREIMDLIR